jgi:hypothetical protein
VNLPHSAAIALILQTGIAAPVLLAQDPAPTPPRDSVARDSVFRGPPDNYGILVALAAFTGMALVAPPSLLLIPVPPSSTGTELAFWGNHVSASVSGGAAFDQYEHTAWAHSVNVELLRHGVYAAARLENVYLPTHYQYRTARVGYLVHPRLSVAGGATIGYRSVPADRAQEGIEIAFPFFMGSRAGSMRLEPAYVISPSGGVTWSYRYQAEVAIGSGPFFAGFDYDAKTLPLRRGSHISSQGMALQLGVRKRS